MFNINNVIEKEYSAAGNYRRKGSLTIYAKMISLVLMGLKLLLLEISFGIYYLFFPRKFENISKQLALVTGGANGLGRALCLRLAQENCDIAVVDLDYESAKKTATEIKEKFGVKSCAYQCDVSNYSAVLELKDKVEKEMKTVDILVNNAGLLYMSEFSASTIKDIQRVVDVNLTSQFMMVHTFLPEMIKQKRGKIIAVASTTAFNPIPSAVVYSSTKFGIDGFMECLSYELAMTDKDEFIQLTTVFPDFMNTRKELSDVLDQIDYIFPRLTPERVADEAVKGMQAGKSKIIVSDIKFMIRLVRLFPNSIRKIIFKFATDMKSYMK